MKKAVFLFSFALALFGLLGASYFSKAKDRQLCLVSMAACVVGLIGCAKYPIDRL